MGHVVFDRSAILGQWAADAPQGCDAVEVWDAAAADYRKAAVPSWDEDPFLRMVADEVELGRGMSVLDIGCGTGAYSLAFAPQVGRVVGCDFSPAMVEGARARAVEAGVDNVEFRQGDFGVLDFGDERFDLVFAHHTPAIGSGAAFEKMAGLSRDWCFLARSVHRSDEVLHAARRLVGVPPMGDPLDEDMLSAVCAVWLGGSIPVVRRHREEWHSERSEEQAVKLYSEHLVAPDLDEGQKEAVREFVRSVACDGVVRETIRTTVFMMGWQV